MAGRFADEAWLAERAPVGEAAQVAGVVAAALGVPEQPGVPTAWAAVNYIPNDSPEQAPAGGVITADGMPGWQIALIALGSALVAAIATVLLDRARTARRTAPPPPCEAPSGRDNRRRAWTRAESRRGARRIGCL